MNVFNKDFIMLMLTVNLSQWLLCIVHFSFIVLILIFICTWLKVFLSVKWS